MFDKKEYAKKYKKQYYKDNREKLLKQQREWRKDNPDKTKEYEKRYQKKHPGERAAISKRNRQKTRLIALETLSNGNPICVRCGCDDIRLLEINHIRGGGTRELKDNKYKGMSFCSAIKQGKRKTDDLNVLCRICNAYHALELKYGKLPYKITYK